MGRTFQADEQAQPVGFHRELNQQLMSEFWLVLASRDSPELLSSTERPTLDKVFEKLQGVGWDAFWECFPQELRDQCTCLDEESVDALGILFASSRSRERFQRHFCDAEDTAAAPAAVATPAPRVGTVRSRAAAGLGLGTSSRGGVGARHGSRRFEAVHEALTGDDEDLVSILMDLMGPFCPKLAPKAATDKQLASVAGAVPLPDMLMQSVAQQLGSASGGSDVRLFSLVVSSGHSRSALAAAAALRVCDCRALYVDLQGVFGHEALDNALFRGVFADCHNADSASKGSDTDGECAAAGPVTDNRGAEDEAANNSVAAGAGSGSPAAAINAAAGAGIPSNRAEGDAAPSIRGRIEIIGDYLGVVAADKAAAEQEQNDRCTAGFDQQLDGGESSSHAVGWGSGEGMARVVHVGPEGPGPASSSSSEAEDAWMQEGWGVAPELVYGHVKLLGCACKAPLLLVLNEVDAAMAHEEGRALREMLHKLLVLLPHARVLLTSSAKCELSDCPLLGLKASQPLVLPDSRGVLRSYRMLHRPLLY